MSGVLVLNLDYQPIHIASARRALDLIAQGKATLLESCGTVRSTHRSFARPSVIVLKRYYNVPRIGSNRRWSKALVLERDGYVCQYCGQALSRDPASPQRATVDHVVPKAHFADPERASTWVNTVACCIPCQQRKGDRPLEVTGLKLRRQPKMPRTGYWVVASRLRPEWRQYIEVKP